MRAFKVGFSYKRAEEILKTAQNRRDEPVAMTMRLCILIAECYFNKIFAQECKKDEHAILGMMLRRHTFKKMKTSIAVECNQACNDDFRCHSFNYKSFITHYNH
ncbi:hypothetical protein pdam_00021411 [Pocillopora damicornis]|uniref:Apple domain-containing protein n=1 Tax=Pocillopora damicornis TaxID=46731 RepID=A0A3M6UW14_POCDA|nr:hypothetical protein pdam_00021411 [Pocillopora damicornis]